MVSHVEYAPRALLTLGKRRDRRTDGHQTVTVRLLLDAASVLKYCYDEGGDKTELECVEV